MNNMPVRTRSLATTARQAPVPRSRFRLFVNQKWIAVARRSPTFWNRSSGVELSVSKIYQILGEKVNTSSAANTRRTGYKKNRKRWKVPEAVSAREAVQMDSVDLGGICL